MAEKRELKEYRAWKNMKSRCYSPSQTKGNYKANKIEVCEEWINSFDTFLKDLGEAPSEEYSLDRIDNNLGYCKENCRWTTQDVQCKNRGTFNKLFTYQNETKVLKDWAKHFNIKYTTLYDRIYRYNLTFEKAIMDDPFAKKFEINGILKSLKEWCEVYQMDFKTVNNRIYKHKWDIERALTQEVKRKSK